MRRRLFDAHEEPDLSRRSIRRSEPLDRWEEHLIQPHDRAIPDARRSVRSIGILHVLCGIAAVLLIARLTHVQIIRSDTFTDRAENNYIRRYVTRAVRGVIYDSNRTLLVQNVPRNDAAVIPADLPRDSQERLVLFGELSILLDMPIDAIQVLVNKNEFYYLPVVLKENIDHETTLTLLASYPDNADGVIVVEDFYRAYSAGSAMSHVLGYLGRVTDDDLVAAPGFYTPSSEIGRTGVEASYEDELRGHNGVRTVHINAQGKVVDILATSESVDGCDVVLSIDADLQQAAATALQRMLDATGTHAGVVIAMDPRTGAVRALVSLPTYDNSMFSNGLQGDEVAVFQALNADEHKPFINRAVSGTYPAGSVYKLVTASAVLSEGIAQADTYIDAPGSISIENQFFPGQFFVYKDWDPAGHGLVSVIEALAESADTYFYKVTGGYQDIVGLGITRLKEYSLRFGLGAPLGIDIPGEAKGIVPDDEWKRLNIDEGWYTGDTYNMSIGQGYMTMTPLHVAAFTSVVANNGTLYRPQVVDTIESCTDARTFRAEALRSAVVSPEVLQQVRAGMRLSIIGDKGTGKAFRNYSVPIAGKTGTAQYNNNEREHAWFTAFAPYDDPEIVVTVLVEGGGEGSQSAIPVTRQVLDAYFADTPAQ